MRGRFEMVGKTHGDFNAKSQNNKRGVITSPSEYQPKKQEMIWRVIRLNPPVPCVLAPGKSYQHRTKYICGCHTLSPLPHFIAAPISPTNSRLFRAPLGAVRPFSSTRQAASAVTIGHRGRASRSVALRTTTSSFIASSTPWEIYSFRWNR